MTFAGVLWAMLLLGETLSTWVWISLGLLLAGLVLVRPQSASVPGPERAATAT